jgi:hypothetical protein
MYDGDVVNACPSLSGDEKFSLYDKVYNLRPF